MIVYDNCGKQKKFSQGDIERRTGLLPCYVSRVENGHTVPAVETLEKPARALEVPLYHFFYDGEEPPKLPSLLKRKVDDLIGGSKGKQANYLYQLRKCLSKHKTTTASSSSIWPREWPAREVGVPRLRQHGKTRAAHRNAARVGSPLDFHYFFYSFRFSATALFFFFENFSLTSLASLAVSTS